MHLYSPKSFSCMFTAKQIVHIFTSAKLHTHKKSTQMHKNLDSNYNQNTVSLLYELYLLLLLCTLDGQCPSGSKCRFYFLAHAKREITSDTNDL